MCWVEVALSGLPGAVRLCGWREPARANDRYASFEEELDQSPFERGEEGGRHWWRGSR